MTRQNTNTRFGDDESTHSQTTPIVPLSSPEKISPDAANAQPDTLPTPLARPSRDSAEPSPARRPNSAHAPGKRAPRRRVESQGSHSQSRFTPGDTLAKRYRIRRMLGRGGMGEVYCADDLTLGQPIALKFLPRGLENDPERLTRLRNEVVLARKIAHPNVCRIYDITECSGEYFLSMEYIDGEDLSQVLRGSDSLPTRKVLDLALQLCHGLDAIHRQNILHRDLKPANIMLDRRGRLAITDFGLANLTGSISSKQVREGTPAYMAPEQLQGANVSVQSDIYAVGLILYKMLTGQPAFPQSVPDLYLRIKHLPQAPSLVRDTITPGFDALLLRCLAPDPEQRPSSPREVAEALLELAGVHRAVLKALVVHPPTTSIGATDGLSEDSAAVATDTSYARLFERPVDAVRYAVARTRSGPDREPLTSGFAIHLIETTQRSHTLTEPRLLEQRLTPHLGTPTSRNRVEQEGWCLTQTVAALAEPGQVLMTRAVFDLARQHGCAELEHLRWVAHGSYDVQDIEQTVDLFEVGLAGHAPLSPPGDTPHARRHKAQTHTLGWRPAPGLELPERRGWHIARKLGEGGFGEVWLAEHADTNEQRVFKFCFDAARLRALQREITLFRLLKDSLGERPDIVRIHNWRFDDAPYFIESAYSPRGSLLEWASDRHGLAQVPLDARLNLVAQVAAAAAAAHSVGVLHKDIKPANVLITVAADGQEQAQLGDFGIGGLTDRSRLDAADITALGFASATIIGATAIAQAGTRLYMAPEVMEGKPATIQADIYALGVLLYQMIVGDFTRALAPGWERDIDDEVLREDIACAVDGSPERRLRDAAQLAARLRAVSQRREQRQFEHRAREDAERIRYQRTRSRARRRLLTGLLSITTMFAMVFAVAMAIQSRRIRQERDRAEQERARAETAAHTNQQTSRFLIELFEAPNPYRADAQPTVRELLDRGASRIEHELSDQPALQARLMQTIGVVYGNLGNYERAITFLRQALSRQQAEYGAAHLDVAATQHHLAWVMYSKGDIETARIHAENALQVRTRLCGEMHEDTAQSWALMGDIEVRQDAFSAGEIAYKRALEIYQQQSETNTPQVAYVLGRLVEATLVQGKVAHAEALARRSLELTQQLYSEAHPAYANSLQELAKVLSWKIEYDKAIPLLRRASMTLEDTLGMEHPKVWQANNLVAEALIRRGEYGQAVTLLESLLAKPIPRTSAPHEAESTKLLAWARCVNNADAESLELFEQVIAQHADATPIRRANAFNQLGYCLHWQEHFREAAEAYQYAFHLYEEFLGPTHPSTAVLLISIVDALSEVPELERAQQLALRAAAILHADRNGWAGCYLTSAVSYLLYQYGHRTSIQDVLRRSQRVLVAELGPNGYIVGRITRRLDRISDAERERDIPREAALTHILEQFCRTSQNSN